MDIPQSVKNKYINSSITKQLEVYFPELDYTVKGENIYADSMKLSEKLCDTDSIEFVGCIASKFQVSIRDFGQNIKGKKIYAYIYTGDDETDKSEAIPLFHGIIDEVQMQSNHRIKQITAYDELYTKGNIDVSYWYKHLSFGSTGISLGDLRRSLLSQMGLSYTERTLPNDDIKIKKQYNPSSLQALAVLKSICQINGVFGMIGRDGIFKFISVSDITPTEGAYPGVTLFPPFYPGIGNSSSSVSEESTEPISYYRSLDYQEYSVKPVEMVIVRQSSEDDGGSFGLGDNKYIVQGNMFTLKLNATTLNTIALNIYNNVLGFSYIPYTSNNNGFPWIECGESQIDCLVYDFDNSTQLQDVYKEKIFHVLNRELSGIQNLRDEYNARGDEYQKEFISDIGVSIDIIQRNIQKNIEQYVDENLEDYYDKGEIDDMFEQFDPGTGWSVESVATLPTHGEENVLYLIQGEVVVE